MRPGLERKLPPRVQRLVFAERRIAMWALHSSVKRIPMQGGVGQTGNENGYNVSHNKYVSFAYFSISLSA